MALALLRVFSGASRPMAGISYLNQSLNRFISRFAYARLSNIHQPREIVRKGLIGAQMTYLKHSSLLNQLFIMLKSMSGSLTSSKSVPLRPLYLSPVFFAPLAITRKAQAESRPNGEMEKIKALLKKEPESRTLDERIELFDYLVKKGKEEVKKSENKDIVLVLGNTGAGKSLLINFLYGCTMKEVDGKIIVDPQSPIKEVAEIGVIGASCTAIPKRIPDISTKVISENGKQNVSFTFFDMPGLTENRGVEVALANVIIMKQMIKQAKSVKFIMVSKDSLFDTDNGRLWIESIQALREQFKDRLGRKKHDLCLVITNSTRRLDWIKNDIKALVPQTGLDLSEYAVIYNPLDASDRKKLLNILSYTKEHGKLDTQVSMRDNQLYQLIQIGKEVGKGVREHLEEGGQRGIEKAVKKIEFTYGITNLGERGLAEPHEVAAKAIQDHVTDIIKRIRPHVAQEQFSNQQMGLFNKYTLLKNNFSPFVSFKQFDTDIKDYINEMKDSRLASWTQLNPTIIGVVSTIICIFFTIVFGKKDDNKKAISAGCAALVSAAFTTYAAERYFKPTPEDKMRMFASATDL